MIRRPFFLAADAGGGDAAPPIRLPPDAAPNAGADAEARIQALIRERNAVRSDAQEARAELAEAKEALVTGKTATDAAVAAAKGELAAKVTELEGQIRRGKNRELLLADKIPEDQMDAVLEYLDYQHGKATPAEGQTEPPEFADWYKEARKTNVVLRAAMKPSVRAGADGEQVADPADPPAVKPPKVPAVIPPKAAIIPPKPGATSTMPDLSKVKMGTPEWTAAKAALKKIAMGGK